MIYVILVNYNGAEDTIECLEALLRLDRPEIRAVVVDNASRAGSAERIREWAAMPHGMALPDNAIWRQLPKARRHALSIDMISASDVAGYRAEAFVTLVASPENLGFAGGNNLGLRIALNDPGCTHVWVLNNDTVPMPDALDHLVARCDADPAIGICGSTLLYYDAPGTVQACGASFSRLLARGSHIAPHSDAAALPSQAEVERRLDYVVGASMLLTRRFLETVGLMEERYFLYCEEIDWATRRGRFRLGWAPASRVFHKEGASIGTSQRTRPSDVSLYYMTASSLRFTARHHPAFLPTALLRQIGIAVRYAVRGDRRAAAVMVRAILHTAAGRQAPPRTQQTS